MATAIAMANPPHKVPEVERVRLIVVAALGALLAWSSAVAALDMVNEKRTKQPLMGTLSNSGFALSEQAMARIAGSARVETDAAIAVPDEVAAEARALSLAALRTEPLNGDALRNLAMLERSEGRGDAAHQLLLLGERLSRRDTRTSFLLADDFARRSDLAPAIARLDQAMRTSNSARRTLLPALLQAMDMPGAVPLVARMLGTGVNWEADFWAAAPASSDALPQITQLRVQRASAGYEGVLSHDRQLFRELIRHRQFRASGAVICRIARRRQQSCAQCRFRACSDGWPVRLGLAPNQHADDQY